MVTNRIKRVGWIGSCLLLGICLAITGSIFGQSDTAKPKAAETKLTPAAKRGQELFNANCQVCHNADNADRKIGPGLKGVSKRATFANGDKGGIEAIEHRIKTGTDTGMPSFADKFNDAQMKDLIAYIKTL